MGESGPLRNTWFLGPSLVLNPNGISTGSTVFAGLTSVTDRHRLTNRPTERHATQSVTIGRIYVHSTAMRPNNKQNSMNEKAVFALPLPLAVNERVTCNRTP